MDDYELLDSGDGERLERFGPRVLRRPSRLAVWHKRRDDLWSGDVDAFEHKQGWRGRRADWQISAGGVKLELSLQESGQIGFFPEHLQYLARIREAVAGFGGGAELLNLFAYTGLVSMAAVQAGAAVTHVDISKRVLEWARRNETLQRQLPGKLRYIREDAVAFMRKESRRKARYQVIVADPPSFSRPASGKEWKLEEVLYDLGQSFRELLAPGGKLFFASHLYDSGGQVAANVFADVFRDSAAQIGWEPLQITESSGVRALPSGYLVTVELPK